MNSHGSCIRRVAGLDPAKEGQEWGGVFRHPVVRPGCELEVTNLTLLIGAALDEHKEKVAMMKLKSFFSFLHVNKSR